MALPIKMARERERLGRPLIVPFSLSLSLLKQTLNTQNVVLLPALHCVYVYLIDFIYSPNTGLQSQIDRLWIFKLVTCHKRETERERINFEI